MSWLKCIMLPRLRGATHIYVSICTAHGIAHGCTGSGDNSICVFEEEQIASSDVNPQQKPSFQLSIKKLDAHPTDVNCVRWHPKDPNLLASAGDDGCIRLWHYQKGLDAAGRVLEARSAGIESNVT